MFDDKLIDGRILASVWTLLSQESSNPGHIKINKKLEKISTPVG